MESVTESSVLVQFLVHPACAQMVHATVTPDFSSLHNVTLVEVSDNGLSLSLSLSLPISLPGPTDSNEPEQMDIKPTSTTPPSQGKHVCLHRAQSCLYNIQKEIFDLQSIRGKHLVCTAFEIIIVLPPAVVSFHCSLRGRGCGC